MRTDCVAQNRTAVISVYDPNGIDIPSGSSQYSIYRRKRLRFIHSVDVDLLKRVCLVVFFLALCQVERVFRQKLLKKKIFFRTAMIEGNYLDTISAIM